MKKLIMLAMVLGLLVSGCAGSKEGLIKGSYWAKDGIKATEQELKPELLECRETPRWSKDGITKEEFKAEINACIEAHNERVKHSTNAKVILGIAQFLTLGVAPVSIAFYIAGAVIPSGDTYYSRCMTKKGFTPIPMKENAIDQCMGEKGYIWVEPERMGTK